MRRAKIRKKANHILRSISVRKRLFGLLFFAIMLMVLTVYLVLHAAMENFFFLVAESSTQAVRSIDADIESGIADIESFSAYPVLMAANRSTGVYYCLAYPDWFSSSQLDTELRYINNLMVKQNPQIRLVAVFDMNGHCSFIRTNRTGLYKINTEGSEQTAAAPSSEAWYEKTLQTRGKALLWSSSSVELSNIDLLDKSDMIFVSRAILSMERFQPVGSILLALDTADVKARMEDTRSLYDAQIAYMSEQGSLILGNMEEDCKAALQSTADFSADASGSFTAPVQGKRMLFYYSGQRGGALCALAIPYHSVLARVLQDQMAVLIFLLLACAALTLFLNAVIASIVGPIHTLAKACDRIGESNDFSYFVSDSSQDELSLLATSFNGLMTNIEHLIRDVYEKDMHLTRTELQLLRSQINPHFLYNTLDTIHAKAYIENHAELGDIALHMANLLRYGISAPNEMSTVATEMEMLREYLQLQESMYGDMVSVHINIEQELCAYSMPKLIVQPLVENALIHGLREQKGTLEILGYRDGSDFTLQVLDNGVGVTEDFIEDFQDYMNNKNEHFHSLGLKNVHRRLVLLYGEGYGVTIRSQLGNGTMVSVRIPIKGGEGNA